MATGSFASSRDGLAWNLTPLLPDVISEIDEIQYELSAGEVGKFKKVVVDDMPEWMVEFNSKKLFLRTKC